ncbi:hypothetical protein AAF712_013928 [Marasmius tenuissimus]|uniref:KOW domain-containing protein n=1 Tax=Marasmius tenuissimus TaxID=585030 RepID=A0ABR2ZDF6_9AGAR
MGAGKRRRTGVDSFLDVAAVEDGNDEDEVESEVEERFEVSDDDDDNGSTSARKQVTPEAHEDQQAFIDALCDDLTARYVRDPKPNEGPSLPPQTPLFLPSSSESPTMPTYPSMSPRLSRPISQIPLVDRMDPWERIHTLNRNAEIANTSTLDRGYIREEKKRYSRAVSTRLREYVGPLEWVTVCSGTYRGDVGIAISLPRDDEDDEEDREREEILQNKLKYNPAKKRRLEHEKDIEQMRAEQREFIHELRHEKRGVDFLELEDLRCKRDEFQVLLVPRHPLSEREKSELQQEDPDIIRPFASETDGSSVHRNPPRLFNAKEYDNVEKVKVGELKLYRYNNSMFVREGLLITNYHRKDLLLATSIPLKLEKAFRESNHFILQSSPFPHPSGWSFDDGEDVVWTDPSPPSASNQTPRRGMIVTFKHLQVQARLSNPQTAIVSTKVDAEQLLQSIVGPVDYANETPEGRFLREKKEEETRREQRMLQEVVSKGEHAAQVRHLLKPHKKDDWVIIMTGKDRGKHGRVLARYEDVITVIIPEYHIFATCHVNAAKRIPSPVERDTRLDVFGTRRELVPVPWVGIEVRVTRGPQSGCIGRVEMVERVEGRFGRRLMVGLWVGALKKLVFADHDHILTTLAQRLRDAQPLSERQNVIYGISRSLLTGREPWLGTRVRITKGQLKGQLGLVRGVNVTFETNNLQKDRHVLGKTLSNRKGIQLRIELETHMAVNTGLATVDYLRVRDTKSGRLLNQAYPVRSGSFYDFRPDLEELPVIVEELDRSEGPGTPQWTREEMETMRSDTTPGPHWDPHSISPYPISAISTPQWSGHEIADMRFGTNPESAWDPNASSPLPVGTTVSSPPSPNPEPDNEPLNPSEQAAADRLEEFCLQAFREAEEEETAQAAASVPQHWILHPKLVGLRVQACVEDQDVYLDIVARGNGATAQRKVDGTNRSIHDISTVQRARDLIKPSTEKNLMVVVGGDPEHIGKLVRRVSNFYLGSKSEENHWMILAVIEKTSPTAVENLTSERLELDPKTMLARVYESKKNRAVGTDYMKIIRNAALASNRRMVPVRPLS